jgi:hypothetical protein
MGNRMRIAVGVLIAAIAAAGELRLVDQPPEAERPGPRWLASFDDALASAARDGKPLFLYFTAKW